MAGESQTTPERDWLEEGGFDAGLAGKRLEESATWSAAWNGGPGTNDPARVIAGWVAGRALRRIIEELANGPLRDRQARGVETGTGSPVAVGGSPTQTTGRDRQC